jgi:hypothetical protein
MPTQLIKKYLEEFARWLRNDDSYDDWERGMEPIPGDRTWVKKSCGQCESCSCKMSDKDVKQ